MPPLTSTSATWGWTGPNRRFLVGVGAALAILCGLAAKPDRNGQVQATHLAVDPNNAPARVLVALPQLGPSRVDAIIQARAAGPFETLEDLQSRVRGLGPATTAAIAAYLRFPDRSRAVEASP